MMIVYTATCLKEWTHSKYMIYDNTPYFVVKINDDLSHNWSQNQASLIGDYIWMSGILLH